MQVGDIVVASWSKAKTLRRKIFMIVAIINDGRPGWNRNMEVISPAGTRTKVSEYSLESLDSARVRLVNEHEQAVKIESKARTKLREFDSDSNIAKNWFPRV